MVFDCSNKYNTLYAVDTGNYFLLGACKMFAFAVLGLFNYRNRRLFKKRGQGQVVRGLLLPIYADFFILLFFLNLFVGIVDMFERYCPTDFLIIFVSLQSCIFGGLYFSLAIFLMGHGAGYEAMLRSLKYGVCFGCVTFFMFFYILAAAENAFGIEMQFNSNGDPYQYIVYASYLCSLILFYFIVWILPLDVLYRRPALDFYSIFCVCFYSTLLGLATMAEQLVDKDGDARCYGGLAALLVNVMVFPVGVFYTLQIDSQYWQGLSNKAGKDSLTEAWDQLDIDTASRLASKMSMVEQHHGSIPIIHFGALKLNERFGYVAGGFSRVYFGKYQKKKVALKKLFAIELTPEDITDFYKEALILNTLRHETVVKCKGICVMPPSLILVLEHCVFGSLFEFLYHAPEEVISSRKSHALSVRRYPKQLNTAASERQSVVNPLSEFELSSQNGPRQSTQDGESELDSGTDHEIYLDDVRISVTGRESTSVQDPQEKSFLANVSTFFSFGGGLKDASVSGSIPSVSNLQRPSSALRNLTSVERFNMIVDAITSIAHIHATGYMHCDIKSLNFLVTEDYRLKATDMGEVRPISGNCSRPVPPIPARNWAPPEVLVPNAKAQAYTTASDVFGLSLVVSEILLNLLPFSDSAELYTPAAWYQQLTVAQVRPELPATTPRELRRALETCWNTDPSVRLTALELLKVVKETGIEGAVLGHVPPVSASAAAGLSMGLSTLPESVRAESNDANDLITEV